MEVQRQFADLSSLNQNVSVIRGSDLLLLKALVGDRMRVHTHLPSLTALEKQLLMPDGVNVQKTVSLLMGEKLTLVVSVGNHRITRSELKRIADKLDLPHKMARQSRINPSQYTEKEFGLRFGMISPFIPSGYGKNIKAIFHLPWDVTCDVAVSLSLWKSLLVPGDRYTHVVNAYLSAVHHGTNLFWL